MNINSILKLVEKYDTKIVMGLVVGVVVLLIINLIAQIRISSIRKKYNAVVKGKEGLDLEEILLGIKGDITKINEKFISLDVDIRKINTDLAKTIQKTGFVRYNALEDLGSNQSYSIALLDKSDNGFILTSLYGRDFNASYLKPIESGKSEYKLSKEEEEALNEAIKG